MESAAGGSGILMRQGAAKGLPGDLLKRGSRNPFLLIGGAGYGKLPSVKPPCMVAKPEILGLAGYKNNGVVRKGRQQARKFVHRWGRLGDNETTTRLGRSLKLGGSEKKGGVVRGVVKRSRNRKTNHGNIDKAVLDKELEEYAAARDKNSLASLDAQLDQYKAAGAVARRNTQATASCSKVGGEEEVADIEMADDQID